MVPKGAQIWVAASQVQGCIYVREATATHMMRQNSVTIIRSVSPQDRRVWQKPVGLRAGSQHESTLVRVAMCVPKGCVLQGLLRRTRNHFVWYGMVRASHIKGRPNKARAKRSHWLRRR